MENTMIIRIVAAAFAVIILVFWFSVAAHE